MVPPGIKRLAVIGAAGLAVLFAAAPVMDRLLPAPTVRTETTHTHTETATQAETRSASTSREELRQLQQQNQELAQRVVAAEKRQADTQVRTVERIERYLPSPPAPAPVATPAAAAPAPAVVVVRDQEPAAPTPIPVAPSRDPVEIITRTIEAIDRSRTETSSTADTTAKVETRTAGSGGDGSRIGVGITSSAAPFVSYDLAKGPRLLGLDKLRAGLFLTKPLSGGTVDGGPQLNYGKKVFGLVGYQVRRQTPVVGIGVRF